jgi:hypothetical protein
MVEAVSNPGPKGVHFEENAFLAKLVELGVAIKEAGGDELVEDSHGDRGEEGEDDVVEGEGPGFEDYFPGEGVLEGVLGLIRNMFRAWRTSMSATYPELCHIQRNILIERIQNDFGYPLITPCTMHKQQFSKEAELRNSDIGTPCSL